jgi:hypothetical protein
MAQACPCWLAVAYSTAMSENICQLEHLSEAPTHEGNGSPSCRFEPKCRDTELWEL